MVDEIYFIPNINDAVSFSFKKTVGPIQMMEQSGGNSVNFNVKFMKRFQLIKNIYKLLGKNVTVDIRFISLVKKIGSIDKLFQEKNLLNEQGQ